MMSDVLEMAMIRVQGLGERGFGSIQPVSLYFVFFFRQRVFVLCYAAEWGLQTAS